MIYLFAGSYIYYPCKMFIGTSACGRKWGPTFIRSHLFLPLKSDVQLFNKFETQQVTASVDIAKILAKKRRHGWVSSNNTMVERVKHFFCRCESLHLSCFHTSLFISSHRILYICAAMAVHIYRISNGVKCKEEIT